MLRPVKKQKKQKKKELTARCAVVVQDNEGILEAYAKTWVSGTLDRAAARGSIAFVLPMHHLSCFIFTSNSDKVPFRNKLVKSLLRGYSRKPQLKVTREILLKFLPD